MPRPAVPRIPRYHTRPLLLSQRTGQRTTLGSQPEAGQLRALGRHRVYRTFRRSGAPTSRAPHPRLGSRSGPGRNPTQADSCIVFCDNGIGGCSGNWTGRRSPYCVAPFQQQNTGLWPGRIGFRGQEGGNVEQSREDRWFPEGHGVCSRTWPRRAESRERTTVPGKRSSHWPLSPSTLDLVLSVGCRPGREPCCRAQSG